MSKAATPSKVVPGKAQPKASDEKPARKVLEKVKHPQQGSTNKAKYPFTVSRDGLTIGGKTFEAVVGNFPTDYSPAKHERLAGSDFATKADYLQFRVTLAERQLARLLQMRDAALAGKKGGAANANKLKKMLAKAAEMRKMLLEQGMSEEELAACEEEALGEE